MPVLAINHHYFRSGGTGRGIYPTTPDALRSEVGRLRNNGWRIGNQEDLLAFLAGEINSAEQICFLTFDDGLKEQIAAIKLLASLDACAVCYVSTAPLMDGIVLDVHKLQMIRSMLCDEELAVDLDRRFGFFGKTFDEDRLAIQYRYDAQLSRRVKYFINFVLDEEQRLRWFQEMFVSQFGDERAVASSLYMNIDDLRLLGAQKMLGAHGHMHLPLATLRREHMHAEIATSTEILSRLSGGNPIGISYPYGGKTAVSAELFSEARAMGYQYGFTMERGVNWHHIIDDSLSLRRIDVNDLDAWIDKGRSLNMEV